MKIGAGLSGIAAFCCALVILNLGESRRSVRELHHRFDRSEASLAGARADFDRLREETAGGISRALASLAAREPQDPAELQHDILGPSVQVNVQGSVGGGTLLFSRDTHTYVITACHVIQKILAAG